MTKSGGGGVLEAQRVQSQGSTTMPDEDRVADVPVEETAPKPFVAQTVKREDVPADVLPGSEDVPALNMPKPTRDDPKPVHASAEADAKAVVDKEAKKAVAKEFYDWLRARYGENDQLVKLFAKHAREKLVSDLSG